MTYKLELPRPYVVLVFGILILFTVVGLAMIVMTVLGRQDVPPLFVLIVWCGILGWNWHVVLGVPYRIDADSVTDIRFVSLARTIHISAVAINSLKSAGGGMYVLRCDGGKIRLFANFTGLYALLGEIKKANPQFETRGI